MIDPLALAQALPMPPPDVSALFAPVDPATGGEEILLDAGPVLNLDDVQAVFDAAMGEARSYADQLQGPRARLARFYRAAPFGDEEPGRSRLVLSIVRDTVRAALPTLIRIFTGPEHPAEFVPRSAEAEPDAMLATEYAQAVIFDLNPGFVALHDALLDALTLRAGWIETYWDDSAETIMESFDGLLEPQAAALMVQPGAEPVRLARRPASDAEIAAILAAPEGAALAALPGVRPMLYSLTLRTRRRRAKPCLRAVAAESVLIDPDASDVASARFAAVQIQALVSDLIAEGLPPDEIERAASDSAQPDDVTQARDPGRASVPRASSARDPSTRRVLYTRAWLRMDVDGDGIAELVRVRAVGESPRVVDVAGADHIPLAMFSVLREAHQAIGLGLADLVTDLQETESRTMRAILDSMMQSIFPRTGVIEGQVNLDDAMNTENGAIVRMRQAGALQEFAKPFIAPQALPIIESLETVRETRTGITRTSQGLSAEHLQSTTAMAVAAQVSASQDRLDLMARIAAECGLRDLYRNILRLAVQHQTEPVTIRLRRGFTVIDPTRWREGFDIRVSVAGRGTPTERVAALTAIAAKQQEILTTLGLDNPVVTLPQYTRTLARIIEAAGYDDPGTFITVLPAEWKPPPPPPPKPSIEEVMAGIEEMKTLGSLAEQAARVAQDREEMLLQDDRDRDKAKVDAILKAAELATKGAPVPAPAVIAAMLARDPIPPPPVVPPMPPARPPPAFVEGT